MRVHHEQSTGIEWLITRFREYVVVREKVLLETMVIRKQLELNPNAELSAAAQEVQTEGLPSSLHAFTHSIQGMKDSGY